MNIHNAQPKFPFNSQLCRTENQKDGSSIFSEEIITPP